MKLTKAVINSFKRGRALLTLSSSLLILIFMLFISFPSYSLQMIGYGGKYPLIALQTLIQGLIYDSGIAGLFLLSSYSLLTGILVSTTYRTIRVSGIKSSGYLTALTPSALVGMCSACGAGLIPLLGVSTTLALTPFHGNLWRIIGISIILITLNRIDDPETCSIS